MDLNHLELTGSMVEELFKNGLIISNETPSIEKDPVKEGQTSSQKFKWLGENRKNILIIVNEKQTVYLDDHDLDFLTGILGACKLNLSEVAILNMNNYQQITYQEIINFFKSKIVFLFGVDPVSFGLPMNFPHFQIQAFAGNSFLYIPSLADIEKDKVVKSKLWITLKRLFNI